ncbi:hypothetical protein H0H93_013753 [Arthromyces matolae]|nr:hypothetical protein H0H93_013753 [Arthromyces matolae]
MKPESSNEAYAARKLGLSCAECRRRGCSGTLAATKGNKVLMAQAQRLTEQVKSLTGRIRELEAALTLAGVSQERNGLSDSGDRKIGPSEGLETLTEAVGSLSLGIDGQAKYHGESAGSEREETRNSPQYHVGLPNEILTLMHAFPFGFKDCPYSKSIFIRYLPHKERAMELACVYYSSVAWMYDPVLYEDFVESIIHPLYGSEGYPTTDTIHSHSLAVFFMVLANGNLYDESQPDAIAVSEQYYALARAALSLDSILIEVTCATVQALFLVFRFIYNSSQADKEERWLLTGLATRVAQTVGLQRDSAAWNLDPKEVQRRRNLFWELFVWESWSSLVHGRPGSLFIQHADCKYPEDLHQVGPVADEGSLGFHAWKFRYSTKCMTMSIEHVFSNRTPTFTALLAIDDAIRNYPIPKHLRWPEGDNGYTWSNDPALALQQYCTLCVRDSSSYNRDLFFKPCIDCVKPDLLYIHRSYFAQAIREASDDPLKHRFKKSVIAAFQTSRRIISVLTSLYAVNRLCRYVWFFWSGYFSSCVVLGVLIVESPGCPLADKAMRELQEAIPFFEEGSRLCRPPSIWKFLQTLYQRAYEAYSAHRSGQKRVAPSSSSSDEPDELGVVGGRQAVITTRSNPNSPGRVSGSPPSLHAESLAGSPPHSITGNGYYPQDYSMEDSMHRFEDHSYSSIGKALHDARGPTLSPIGAPNSYVTSVEGVSNTVHQPPSDHIGATKEPWNYGISHDQARQNPSYLPFVHSHNAPIHENHAGISYAYPPRPLQEQTAQNQDEIWRNFMMGYGP